MRILAIDIGSSSVKSAILRNAAVSGEIVRAPFVTTWDGVKVEVNAEGILKAVAAAIAQLGAAAKSVDLIALSVMAPSWLAMDKKGNALTPVVTHQDRRSVEIARQIEASIGKARHLRLAGNRPFPGGISSTTAAWFLAHEKSLMRRADLVGHLNTFLHRKLTGARVVDPSNASFMGLYKTLTLGGWSYELCDAAGISPNLLPQVKFANEIGGCILPDAARRFGLQAGAPMTVGLVDTGAAMLLIGAKPGQPMNVSGSTDVLILCTDKPKPHEKLLTRAIGVGKRWTSVSTIAAAGSSLNWAREQFFADLTTAEFYKLLATLAAKPLKSSVRFEPYLAGERTSIEQRQAAFSGLTLATNRRQMLSAIIESLAAASAARLPLLQHNPVKISHNVVVSGGVQAGLDKILYRDWEGQWSFRNENEATLRGLGMINPKSEIRNPKQIRNSKGRKSETAPV